ncbi:polysaccharide lyase 6 family protein [Xanthomonas arboricola]|uniref:polysaccharide lyase 6 family protein n=1 Tax=Xanthomonas arboricola TaxID=56448 RepID=UPI00215815D1|nr:polysaccharide lyase 6 family protein [Xanthomonas arboricola]
MRSPVSLACLLLLYAPAWVGSAQATSYLVHDQSEYAVAAAALRAGDRIVLADGQWRDFAIVLRGQGTAEQPITLTAQTPGKVIISGTSDLHMAGTYLVVSDLVFRDGHSPGDAVLSYRISSKERARNSRITGVVVDGFSKPTRSDSDNWVALYDSDNRFDHNQLVGKTNAGPTLVVVRDATQGLDNRHRIDHNWFGPRPNLGANGGETLRIGTSSDADSASNSVVDNNWFEGCDGEVEVVSNKSGGNTYRGNVFKQSRGALVLRHGDGNLVERNVFFGDGKANTGGIRVINRKQTVRHNYLENLAGDGYSSALSIMYGVPNSPANRYVQVDQARIERNTFVTVNQLYFGAGMDAERTAAPINSRFAGNLIVAASDPVRVLGDLSGIAFTSNMQSPLASTRLPGGVNSRQVTMTRASTGLLVADNATGVGADPALSYIARTQVGVSWYPKQAAQAVTDSGRRTRVRPGQASLTDAVAQAGPGDRLQLDAGRYQVDDILDVDRPLTLEGPQRGRARIRFSQPALFQIAPGGSLSLARLEIDGRAASAQPGNAVIRTAPGSAVAQYQLTLRDTHLHHLDAQPGFDVIALGKGSLADHILLDRLLVEDVSGQVLSAHAETDDRGTYNVEQVTVRQSQFHRVAGPVLDLYRGGRDESTFGPVLQVSDSHFTQVGRNAGASLRLHGVQRIALRNNRFADSAAILAQHTTGTPHLIASGNQFVGTPALHADAAEPLL